MEYPRRGQSWDVRCTKGICLHIIRINKYTINTLNIDGVSVTVKINITKLVAINCYFHFAMFFTQKFKAVYKFAIFIFFSLQIFQIYHIVFAY